MNKKKFFVSMFVTFLVVIFVAGGLFAANFLFGTSLSDTISSIFDRSKTGKINVLLLGVDKDKTRSDVMMVVSVDPEFNTIKVLSIPRDTRVKVSETKHDKINHSMGYKNPEEMVIKMVKQVTGMPIHYYCEISFEGFRNIIDILGGVEFDVPVDMHYEDPAQDLYIHVNKGKQVLNGKDAEGVVRFRKSYATGDLGRINTQQDFLKALFEQKLQPQYIAKAPSIIKEVYEHVKTNLSVADALKYVKMLKKMDANSLSVHMLPGNSRTISGVSYFIYDEAKTKQLVLEEFGYPEEEAKKLATPETKK